MSTEIKKYEITVLGELYTLVSDQGEGHILATSQKVNEIIKEISQKAPYLEPKKIAVLTALKIAGMLVACEHDLRTIQAQGQALLDHLDRELFATSSLV